MPGYGRHQLRAVEGCPEDVRLVVELQFRGAWFSQESGRDWTPMAFLVNREHGVGLEVAGNTATAAAVQATLARLVDEPVSRLVARMPLSAPDFYELGEADVVGSVLRWMDEPESFKKQHPNWRSFRQLCKKSLGFDPEEDSAVGAARRLGERDGEWMRAWNRFTEAPANYPSVPELLRAARPEPAAQSPLFRSQAETVWPQDNEEAENGLRTELVRLAGRTPADLRSALAALDVEHGARRSSVWARLNRTPLAGALEHLVVLATSSSSAIGGPTLQSIIDAYAANGWRADDALLRALGAVEQSEDVAAVSGVVCGIYRPWAEAGVGAFVDAFSDAPVRPAEMAIGAGSCRLFSDGLRYDLGQRLAAELRRRDLVVHIEPTLATVPTVTATAKPAVSPVAQLVSAGDGLGTKVVETGSALTADAFRRLLSDNGVQALAPHEFGDPTGRGWTELGDIDQLGHAQGLKLPRYVDDQIRAIADRAASLLKAGWRQVEVVTDHGWILDPLGLDKVVPPLPESLTEVRKGRCARVRGNASVDFPTLPWHWDPSIEIAIAPGLRAFEAGKVYEHGGVSVHESITPRLTIRRGNAPVAVSMSDVRWVGLRCRVRVEDAPNGAVIDLRVNPAQPDSSIATHPVEFDGNGNASLLVASDEHEGMAAAVVVLAADGTVLGQHATIVGESS